jgi:hypothetical protein
MITSDNAWELYNNLANEVRETIAAKAKLIPKIKKEFLFEAHGLEEYRATDSNGIIAGLILDEGEIKVIVTDEFGMGEYYSLFSGSIHIVDLLGIIENVETYEINNSSL